MNWLNLFEFVCYIIGSFGIIYSLKNKHYRTLFAFGSGAIFGYSLELLSVNVGGHYYYNPDFWLNIGREPGQFPVFGGIMWGLLIAYSINIAHKFKMTRFQASLFAGLLVVGFDFAFDVIAVRLDGGFWTWVGVPIDLTITPLTFLGVIWGNYSTYFFIVSPLAWLTLQTWEKVAKNDIKNQFIHMMRNYFLCIVFFILATVMLVKLSIVTHGYLSIILFLALFLGTLIAVFRHLMRTPLKLSKQQDIGMIVFWIVAYLCTLGAMIHLDLHTRVWWLFAYCIVAMLATLYVALTEPARFKTSL
jgi:hypothetical protein